MIDNYTKKCKSTVGGLKKIYLIPFVEYTRSQIKTLEMNLTEFPSSYIYEFDCVGNYTQSSSIDGGAVYFEQNISLQLNEVYSILDINEFVGSEFRVIVETNNNDLLMFGAYNGLECEASNNSGTDKAEFNGFSLEFKGKEVKAALLIDDLDLFNLYKFNKEEVLNSNFNFNI